MVDNITINIESDSVVVVDQDINTSVTISEESIDSLFTIDEPTINISDVSDIVTTS